MKLIGTGAQSNWFCWLWVGTSCWRRRAWDRWPTYGYVLEYGDFDRLPRVNCVELLKSNGIMRFSTFELTLCTAKTCPDYSLLKMGMSNSRTSRNRERCEGLHFWSNTAFCGRKTRTLRINSNHINAWEDLIIELLRVEGKRKVRSNSK